MMNNKITILVADDHKLFRTALSMMLSGNEQFEVVGEAWDGQQVVKLAVDHKPDIILLDINIEGISGIEAAPIIRKLSPLSKIIGVSIHTHPAFVHKMMQAGVMGYVTKNSPSAEIFQAIEEVYQGKKYVCKEVKNILADMAFFGKPENIPSFTLSEKEWKVVDYLIKGYTSKEIAGIMNLSKKTIDLYRQNVMKKFQVKNIAGLVSLVQFLNNSPVQ